MKRLLSLLMCFVFLQAQTFAWRGGPGGGATRQVTGSFSGTLVETAATGTDVGLFLITIPGSGPASGQIVIFTAGAQGTISGTTPPVVTASKAPGFTLALVTGLSDPAKGTFTGVFGGANALTSGGGGTGTGTGAGGGGGGGSIDSIAGTMTATVANSSLARSSSLRLNGTATAQSSSRTTATSIAGIDPVALAGVKTFLVDGWQISSSNAAALSFPPLTTSTIVSGLIR